MKKTTYYALISLVLMIIVLSAIFAFKPAPIDVPDVPIVTKPETPVIKSEGLVTIKILERAIFTNLNIEPQRVLEDSRCATDVQCVWAGQIKIETKIVGKSTITHSFLEGSKLSFEGYDIVLKKVEPYPVSTKKINSSDYRFTFLIEKTKTVTEGKCYVGGCSGQLCSENPGLVSTCEYLEVYGCYQGATCERQQNGKCGWTETQSLKACVASKSE